MDSLKETDKPATNLPKASPYRSRRGADASDDRRTSPSGLKSRPDRIPEPERGKYGTPPEGNTSAPAAEQTNVDTQTTTVKEPAGFRRKKIILPDFERDLLRSGRLPEPLGDLCQCANQGAKCRKPSDLSGSESTRGLRTAFGRQDALRFVVTETSTATSLKLSP